MSGFINTYLGMYLVQTLGHSIVAALMVNAAIAAWRIKNPVVKQRLRLVVVILPIVSFPLYQELNPERGSVTFRLSALLDVNKWITIELWDGVYLGMALTALLALVAFVFIFQELIPIILHAIGSLRASPENDNHVEDTIVAKAVEAIRPLPLDESGLHVMDDDDLFLFSSTGMKPVVHVSSGLVKEFSVRQLTAAIAHEVAHITRSRRPILVLVYILRGIMFYNPITLLAFRKIVHEEEKICDDMAISMTGDSEALAEAIDMMRPEEDDATSASEANSLLRLTRNLEYYSQDLLLRSRIQRVRNPAEREPQNWGLPYFVTILSTMILNYFIV